MLLDEVVALVNSVRLHSPCRDWSVEPFRRLRTGGWRGRIEGERVEEDAGSGSRG